MEAMRSKSQPPSQPWRWLPEFLELTKKRSWSQGRLFGSAVLVGIVSGLGAVLFSVLCQFVIRYSLDGVAGYRAAGPASEARVDWLTESATILKPWFLILTCAVGGLASAILVCSLPKQKATGPTPLSPPTIIARG